MQETGQKILSLVETQVSSAPNFGSNAINVLRYCCTNHDRVPYSAEPDYSEVNCGGLVHCKGALPTSNEPRRCFKVSRMRPELIVPSASSSWHLFHGKERHKKYEPLLRFLRNSRGLARVFASGPNGINLSRSNGRLDHHQFPDGFVESS